MEGDEQQDFIELSFNTTFLGLEQISHLTKPSMTLCHFEHHTLCFPAEVGNVCCNHVASRTTDLLSVARKVSNIKFPPRIHQKSSLLLLF